MGGVLPPPPASQNRPACFCVHGIRWKANTLLGRCTSVSLAALSSQAGVRKGSFLHDCMETEEEVPLSKRTNSLHVLGDGKGFDDVILSIRVLDSLWKFNKLVKCPQNLLYGQQFT